MAEAKYIVAGNVLSHLALHWHFQQLNYAWQFLLLRVVFL